MFNLLIITVISLLISINATSFSEGNGFDKLFKYSQLKYKGTFYV